MTLTVGASPSSYGVALIGEPIAIDARIDVASSNPIAPFPYFEDPVDEIRITVTGPHDTTLQPTLRPAPSAPPRPITARRAFFNPQPLSAWGYVLRTPGRYHLSFSFDPITTNWAIANGWHVDESFSGDVRVVRSYADADRHLFPPPKGWGAAPEDCFPVHRARLPGIVSFRGYGTSVDTPDLARAKALPNAHECFVVVVRGDATLDEGLNAERALATNPETIFVSEDDRVPCGSVSETVFTYRSKSAPYTRTQAVILKTEHGYIVARYRRPESADDDEDALDALDAPCRVL